MGSIGKVAFARQAYRAVEGFVTGGFVVIDILAAAVTGYDCHKDKSLHPKAPPPCEGEAIQSVSAGLRA